MTPYSPPDVRLVSHDPRVLDQLPHRVRPRPPTEASPSTSPPSNLPTYQSPTGCRQPGRAKHGPSRCALPATRGCPERYVKPAGNDHRALTPPPHRQRSALPLQRRSHSLEHGPNETVGTVGGCRISRDAVRAV